jgi:hypothetical protein
MIRLICGSAKPLRIGGGERELSARCGAFLNRPQDVDDDLPACSPGLTESSGDLPDLIQGTYPPFLRDCWSRRSGAVRARLHTRMRLRDPRAGRPSPTVGGRGCGSAQWSGRSSMDPQAFMAEVTTGVAATCSLANKNLRVVSRIDYHELFFLHLHDRGRRGCRRSHSGRNGTPKLTTYAEAGQI